MGTDSRRVVVPYDASGKFVARVPKGEYLMEAQVLTPKDDSQWWGYEVGAITEPTVSVTGNLALALDARAAKPVGFMVDSPGAASAYCEVSYRRVTPVQPTGTDFLGTSCDDLYLRPSQSSAPADQFSITTTVPDPHARVRDKELAASRTEVAASAPDEVAMLEGRVPVRTPGRITEYFTPGVAWHLTLGTVAADDPTQGRAQHYRTETFHRGDNGVRRWNVGVFGPSLTTYGTTDDPIFPVQRWGDTIELFAPSLFTEPLSYYGGQRGAAWQVALWRDGELVGSATEPNRARFTVPAGAARYRLGAVATRDTAVVSTRVEVAWEFTSDTTTAWTALPATVVRYAPALDDRNRAPAGRSFSIPLRLERLDAPGSGTVAGVTVDVSYDDGATWQPAQVNGTGLTRTAVVDHPAGTGFAALRARVTDDAGNTVDQTIIRAYALA